MQKSWEDECGVADSLGQSSVSTYPRCRRLARDKFQQSKVDGCDLLAHRDVLSKKGIALRHVFLRVSSINNNLTSNPGEHTGTTNPLWLCRRHPHCCQNWISPLHQLCSQLRLTRHSNASSPTTPAATPSSPTHPRTPNNSGMTRTSLNVRSSSEDHGGMSVESLVLVRSARCVTSTVACG